MGPVMDYPDKHETSRFGGEGQCFKAKLIGILEVSEARGDRMCQEALSDLKMAIRAAGEHKQRITVHIALDGLRLRDEKTGDCLYHHPVHKISFIAQDMTDSRAFGYIFGSPDTGHRFFGIKTDKAASQVVIAMRDLFQIVFALKKKEIELAKQHLEKNCLYNSPLFSDSSSNKSVTPELPAKYEAIKSDKATSHSADAKISGTAVANLVDLQLELNSLQQGLHQMEKITPSEPFISKDPFGDSFTSFPNPILPPPPSSGKDRSSRNSESSNIFSPKTPHTGDSLTTSSGMDTYSFSSLSKTDFKISRDFSSSHEEPSSGEWFTPSNSLFEETSLVSDASQKTQRDEKLEQTKRDILSQFDVFTELDPLELKNPPKKVLNDLVSHCDNKDVVPKVANMSKSMSGFESDPFGEDPFVSLDPFAETEFKQDPFEKGFLEQKKNSVKSDATMVGLLSTGLSKSPNSSALGNICGTSPKNVKFNDNLDHHDDRLSEIKDGERVPDPPPRPDAAVVLQFRPPPLPPKKQTSDLFVKPPPRPPHVEDTIYGYMDRYETLPSTMNSKSAEKTPALPIPMRKSKFESDFSVAPERPAKQFVSHSFEDDYLTPIQLTKPGEFNIGASNRILLPPPTTNLSKSPGNTQNTPLSSTLNTHLNGTTNLTDSLNNTLDGLDITLSQLTLSGLNELASKLNIPTTQLSNMTLVQLTEYLSNVIQSKSNASDSLASIDNENNSSVEFPDFKADFESNFGSTTCSISENYDRYAVFRELINEEIKQTKIDTEPEEFQEDKNGVNVSSVTLKHPVSEASATEDRYAALREIVEIDLLKTENKIDEENEEVNMDQGYVVEKNGITINDTLVNDNVIIENELNKDEKIRTTSPYIDYNKKQDDGKEDVLMSSPKSPLKTVAKSPIPNPLTDMIQTNVRLHSGSLSDIVSGSSPEVDNILSNSEVGHKTTDTTGESWAIFDQTNIPQETMKEKQATQSEEGLSPWSSDSKDGNGSPSDYRRGDSESGGDHWIRKGVRKDQEGWWDTSAEPEMPYSSSNRRSTDSYEEEYYECYDRPRRRRQGGWVGHGTSGQVAGGHSSSSRDVSPWEEEPKRRDPRDSRGSERIGWSRTSKQQFDRYRERRPTDSWDEEDDYEYGDPRRFHWSDKFSSRESDRHSAGSRDNDSEPRERWEDEWLDERRRRRRRETDRDHWCCPDWEAEEHEKPSTRYGGSGRWSSGGTPPGKWRERKHDDRYYSREESPWEDDYPVEKEDMHSSHYVAKRNWKRPNSASEMDRKTAEFKARHLGGSDGERDRRYKGNRRSRSRDSQYSEPSYRHKPDTSSLTRSYKNKNLGQYIKPPFETEFADVKKQIDSCHSDLNVKKTFTLQNRKKKESAKSDENTNTFPRKSKLKQSFENNFQPEAREFENNFHLEGEVEVPSSATKTKLKTQLSMLELQQRKSSRESKPRGYQNRSKSLFEDDFSLDKVEHLPEDSGISVIKEEIDTCEENDSFGDQPANSSNRLSKRLSGGLRTDLKKSESVNIFARENDPFDDEFFCENSDKVRMFDIASETNNPRDGDRKWTDSYNT